MADGAKQYEVVMAVNYYTPYVSGLTDTARMLAEELVRRGHSVAVVACRHDSSLPLHETLNGVDVFRSRVVARIGKGLISPGFPSLVARIAKRGKVLNLHAPMIESGVVATMARKTPLVVTYHCDVMLAPGLVNATQTRVMDRSNTIAIRRSAVTVPSSDDYARSSRLARDLLAKSQPIAPPTRLYERVEPAYRETGGLHVGFLGRIVEEKGLEFLVEGFRHLPDPNARLLIGGDYAKVAGGSVVDTVRQAAGSDPRIRILGFVPDEAIPSFYSSLDVFALPSVNALEAFGIVQVEAMKMGVASMASDLPGVRIPVQRTGFGQVIAPRDPAAVHTALERFAAGALDSAAGAQRTNELYSLARTVDEYEAAFAKAIAIASAP
ncbi:glycosyltransferase family 4 protein [Diaminobutyricimonas sp. TR449]|uniref:glycosyltransferase family 4 protein n=1 Tax=Diaminobutyricimonas sp. TR449 TaxID=2708076 RepID=UPI00142430F5|nr:glycosyltransferase family 4 protein [Diaminobutyricimonas sp. TR449]